MTDKFDIHQWVVASGGNVRGSASYQLGDTAGQPAASGANAFQSDNYTLSSGFWGLNKKHSGQESDYVYLPLLLRQ